MYNFVLTVSLCHIWARDRSCLLREKILEARKLILLLTTAAARHCCRQAEAAAKTQTKAKVAFDDFAVPETAALLVKESCVTPLCWRIAN